jgi:hypothetical protein
VHYSEVADKYNLVQLRSTVGWHSLKLSISSTLHGMAMAEEGDAVERRRLCWSYSKTVASTMKGRCSRRYAEQAKETTLDDVFCSEGGLIEVAVRKVR